MESEASQIPSPEPERTTPLAFLLDVDGVITNPTEKKVTEPQIFDFLEKQLENGNPVTLNTGRSNQWMIERVINPLAAKIKNKRSFTSYKEILKRFFAVGEKGLTWASFDENGNLVEGVFDRNGNPIVGFDLTVFLDDDIISHFQILRKEAENLINSKYSHSTFFDKSKKAMISTEMLDGYDQSKYSKEQEKFTNELLAILKKEGLEGKFKIDPTTIATDIQLPEAGKHLGARRILDWLKSRNVNPQHFITVGDSASDLEMADELSNQEKSVKFYYVQPQKVLDVEKPYKIKQTKAQFGQGTVEMFEKLDL